eukprot:1758447-Pleurochrysis_carterae.AAC.1
MAQINDLPSCLLARLRQAMCARVQVCEHAFSHCTCACILSDAQNLRGCYCKREVSARDTPRACPPVEPHVRSRAAPRLLVCICAQEHA